MARASRPATPVVPARNCVTTGPRIAPALPPAAIGPNRRFASSPLKTSAMKLQKTDTTKKLNTDSHTKNALAVAADAGSAWKATAKPSRFSAKKPLMTGSNRRLRTRDTRAPNRGVRASITRNVVVKSHGIRPTPALAPIASRTGRSR